MLFVCLFVCLFFVVERLHAVVCVCQGSTSSPSPDFLVFIFVVVVIVVVIVVVVVLSAEVVGVFLCVSLCCNKARCCLCLPRVDLLAFI